MPIKEVPMYRAVCDVCGVGNHDSEYWAWAEADQARSEWDDDRSGKHSPSDDGLSCVECDRPLPPVAAVSAPPEENQK